MFTIRKAYKFRLKVKDSEQFHNFSGANRYIWNKFLGLNLARLEKKQKLLWYNEMAFWLTFWKKTDELSWLKETQSQTLQQTLKSLDRAFKDAFDRKQPLKRVPTFKRKSDRQSFRYPQGFKIEGNRIFLPKLGWFVFKKSRNIEGIPKNVTVSFSNGHWFVSIQTQLDLESQPSHPSKSAIGIDRGITDVLAMSDGQLINPLYTWAKHQDKIKQSQRRLSKKKKFSQNWKKEKAKLTKLHSKVSNCRNDFLHKTSTAISKSHAMVVVEDLQIRNMTSSAMGSLERPGKNVKAKAGLNRSILDKGWGNYSQYLEYKLKYSGGALIKVPPQFTSQRCSICQSIEPQSRNGKLFKCASCGVEIDADINAAKNILAAGHAVLACGEDPLGTSVKQEPDSSVKKNHQAA